MQAFFLSLYIKPMQWYNASAAVHLMQSIGTKVQMV